mmetsp:Transcript_3067/g.5342  ORF Transcript_3067/g.5342 Transcript_3067/m.5342 type:complete len:120 (+) Transcript_3067:2170-2529(+)
MVLSNRVCLYGLFAFRCSLGGKSRGRGFAALARLACPFGMQICQMRPAPSGPTWRGLARLASSPWLASVVSEVSTAALVSNFVARMGASAPFNSVAEQAAQKVKLKPLSCTSYIIQASK